MDAWLMKTNQEWGNMFMHSPSFVGMDEEGLDTDFGCLDAQQRTTLFTRLQQAGTVSAQYGLVKQFFDEFYDSMDCGDLIVLGTGQRTQFNVTALFKVTSSAYFFRDSDAPRHRRDVAVLWHGKPFPVQNWGFARRLERLDTLQHFKELAQVLVRAMEHKGFS